jgi:hypothetical protein
MPDPNQGTTKQAPVQPVIAEPEFTTGEIARLMALRDCFERGDYRELSQEHKRLLFVRWLIENGRLSG